MAKEYDYSSQYIEKDPNIKQRRCRFCNNMVKTINLELKNCCKTCYTKKHNKKRCSKCLLRKSTKCFEKNKSYKDGYKSVCKSH
jgi:hypothetical protein